MDLGPRAGDIVASVEDLVFAASSVMVFLGPQAPPMPATASPATEPEEQAEQSSVNNDGGVSEAGITTSAAVAGDANEAPSVRGENGNGLSSPIPALGLVDDRGGSPLAEELEAKQEGGRHGQHGGGSAEHRGETWGGTPAHSLQMSPVSPSRSPVPGGPSVLGEVGLLGTTGMGHSNCTPCKEVVLDVVLFAENSYFTISRRNSEQMLFIASESSGKRKALAGGPSLLSGNLSPPNVGRPNVMTPSPRQQMCTPTLPRSTRLLHSHL